MTDALAILRRLVEALPRCDCCPAPATRAWLREPKVRWCEDLARKRPLHAPPEYPYATALREAIELLAKENDS